MANGRLKFFLGLLAVVLLAAPAVLRAEAGPPRWVLVRMGTRPMEDDPNHQLSAHVARLLRSVSDYLDPVVLAYGLIGLIDILAGMLWMERQEEGIVDFPRALAVESGLYTSRAGRAPPSA